MQNEKQSPHSPKSAPSCHASCWQCRKTAQRGWWGTNFGKTIVHLKIVRNIALPREINREINRKIHRGINREINREIIREINRGIIREINREIIREINREKNRSIIREINRGIKRNIMHVNIMIASTSVSSISMSSGYF